jgi:hypothetical protein
LFCSGLVLTSPARSDAASVPVCGRYALAMTIGPANSTAGVTYYPLIFTNITKTTCSVEGTPTVHASSSVTFRLQMYVGPGAKPAIAPAPAPVTLRPKASALATYGVVGTGSYSGTPCHPVATKSLSVQLLPRYFFQLINLSVCTHLASTNITPLTAMAPPTTTTTQVPVSYNSFSATQQGFFSSNNGQNIKAIISRNYAMSNQFIIDYLVKAGQPYACIGQDFEDVLKGTPSDNAVFGQDTEPIVQEVEDAATITVAAATNDFIALVTSLNPGESLSTATLFAVAEDIAEVSAWKGVVVVTNTAIDTAASNFLNPPVTNVVSDTLGASVISADIAASINVNGILEPLGTAGAGTSDAGENLFQMVSGSDSGYPACNKTTVTKLFN